HRLEHENAVLEAEVRCPGDRLLPATGPLERNDDRLSPPVVGRIEPMRQLRLFNRPLETEMAQQELHPGVNLVRVQRPSALELGERSVRVPSTVPAEEQPSAVDVGEGKLRIELEGAVELAPRLREPGRVGRVPVESEGEVGRAQTGMGGGVV